jgi:hypothetical protein
VRGPLLLSNMRPGSRQGAPFHASWANPHPLLPQFHHGCGHRRSARSNCARSDRSLRRGHSPPGGARLRDEVSVCFSGQVRHDDRLDEGRSEDRSLSRRVTVEHRDLADLMLSQSAHPTPTMTSPRNGIIRCLQVPHRDGRDSSLSQVQGGFRMWPQSSNVRHASPIPTNRRPSDSWRSLAAALGSIPRRPSNENPGGPRGRDPVGTVRAD